MTDGAQRRPLYLTIAINLAALAAFWLLALVIVRGAATIAAGPIAKDAALIVACGVGVGIAMKLNAKVAAVLLSGQVAIQAAILAIHSTFGARLLQGPGVAWALIIAGTGGAILGALMARYFLVAWQARNAQASA